MESTRLLTLLPIQMTIPIGPNHLRVGEASYAVDPLSSQGVQHALSSALQGSIMIHVTARASRRRRSHRILSCAPG